MKKNGKKKIAGFYIGVASFGGSLRYINGRRPRKALNPESGKNY
jgi:hypothetical protein